MRIKGLIAVLFGTIMLTACSGVVDQTTSTGTIDKIETRVGGGAFSKDRIYFNLVGETTVYECWMSEVDFCRLLAEGNYLEVTAGVNTHYSKLENFVTSATLVTSPATAK